MPTLTFTQDSMSTREEMQRLIEEMRQRLNPIDDLVELTQDITLFEQKYKMTSAEFFAKYQRGEMGDDMDFIEWLGTIACILISNTGSSYCFLTPS